MNDNRRKKSIRLRKTALSAMFTALGTVILFLGGALGDLDLTVSAVASLIVLICLIEMGAGSALGVFAATSALSLILFPSYFIVPMYICFVGGYPVVKYYSEKLKKPIARLIKFLYMNAMLTALAVLGMKLYGLDSSDGELFGLIPGRYALLALYIIANMTFLLFDYCLSKLTVLYNAVLAKRIGIYKLFK